MTLTRREWPIPIPWENDSSTTGTAANKTTNVIVNNATGTTEVQSKEESTSNTSSDTGTTSSDGLRDYMQELWKAVQEATGATMTSGKR